MSDSKISAEWARSIGAVERDTGLGKDTLRVWERRYQFPQPQRDANGERVYPPDQVNKLRLLKRLIDHGHRPGKIIHLEQEHLQKLSEGIDTKEAKLESAVARADLQGYLELCKTHRIEELRRALSQALLKMGLQGFVLDVISPLNQIVGDSWARGQLEVFEEHLYTEVVQNLLRSAISTVLQHQPSGEVRPRVMLTTFPQEQHCLGLLMAEAICALEGARCLSLGVQMPVIEIARAAKVQQADIVALSFSSSMNPNQVLDGLSDLASMLHPETEIWAGGSCSALTHRPVRAVRVLTLTEIPAALADWYGRHRR